MPSKEKNDRREKMLAYQSLPSLQEYVLVAQDEHRVEIYRRCNDWNPEIISEGDFPLHCLDVRVPLADVYIDVTG